jgi:hypothetical protein
VKVVISTKKSLFFPGTIVNMSDTDQPSKSQRYIVKPAVVGAVGYALSSYVMPQFDPAWNGTLATGPGSMLKSIFPESVSVPILIGVACMAGSVLSEYSHDVIFPNVAWDDKSSARVTQVVAGGINAAGVSGVLTLANPDAVTQLGLPSIIAFGLGVEVAGDMLYGKFLSGSESV